MFYSSRRILSYNKTFNYIIGERAGGKSFDWKYRAINDFKKKETRKVWVRREKTEFSKDFMTNFFTDIQWKYPNDKFEIKETESGAFGFINDELFIYFIALSTVHKHKSIPYINVDFIVLDEFILNPYVASYLKGEVFRFMELFHTVARPTTRIENGIEVLHDPKTRAVFLGNSISIVNPYFTYFNFKIDRNKQFNVFENAVVEIWDGDEHQEFMKTTSLGKAIKGTSYSDYADSNDFLLDNDDWIANKTSNSRYLMGFIIDEVKIGLWADYHQGLLYANNQFDPSHMVVTVLNQDHQPNLLMFRYFKRQEYYKQLKTAFENGLMRYNSHATMTMIYDIMSMV